jgi:hypothetical protein
MSLISSYCKQCIFLDVQTKLKIMKQIHFFILSFLLCLFFSCSSRKHTKTIYFTYSKVLDTLPELRKPVLKKLKRFDKNIQDYFVVPYFNSHMDTIPSLDLFLSGRYQEHLVFILKKKVLLTVELF